MASENKNETSPHILNTSATLLGLCFIVLTSLQVNNRSEGTIIDELTGVAIMLFMTSCLFSFLSIRRGASRGLRLERAADIIFLSGLLFLFIITFLVTFNFVE